ncbi:hypothetical protein DFJ74DRAFT_663676 [Hyaloraphidium curvatum]|nr:hypothetical protein DFJ74DRAFT_663676 [Hyaloraphidium curvatum]
MLDCWMPCRLVDGCTALRGRAGLKGLRVRPAGRLVLEAEGVAWSRSRTTDCPPLAGAVQTVGAEPIGRSRLHIRHLALPPCRLPRSRSRAAPSPRRRAGRVVEGAGQSPPAEADPTSDTWRCWIAGCLAASSTDADAVRCAARRVVLTSRPHCRPRLAAGRITGRRCWGRSRRDPPRTTPLPGPVALPPWRPIGLKGTQY